MRALLDARCGPNLPRFRQNGQQLDRVRSITGNRGDSTGDGRIASGWTAAPVAAGAMQHLALNVDTEADLLAFAIACARMATG